MILNCAVNKKRLAFTNLFFIRSLAVDTKSTTQVSGAFRIPFDAVGNPPDGVFHRKQKGTHKSEFPFVPFDVVAKKDPSFDGSLFLRLLRG